ncbi:MAG: 16S rRNA (cytosine(1402)-N(4))-methyltransferase RsmH, partial [Oscillospiraceae bacterium]
MEFKHISVLLEDCINGLNIKENGIYIDGTCGGGGHSLKIAEKLLKGKLISIDQDPDALEFAEKKLSNYNVTLVQNNFCNLKTVANSFNISGVDGILLDLGVSSYQLDNGQRGFSYNANAPLDMRMSKQGLSA